MQFMSSRPIIYAMLSRELLLLVSLWSVPGLRCAGAGEGSHQMIECLYVRIAFLIRGCSNATKYYFNCFGCWSVQRADRLQDEICPLQPKYKDVIFGLNFKEDCVVAPLLPALRQRTNHWIAYQYNNDMPALG